MLFLGLPQDGKEGTEQAEYARQQRGAPPPAEARHEPSDGRACKQRKGLHHPNQAKLARTLGARRGIGEVSAEQRDLEPQPRYDTRNHHQGHGVRDRKQSVATSGDEQREHDDGPAAKPVGQPAMDGREKCLAGPHC